MFDTMVFTKALGALCGALLIFLLGKWVADSLYVPGSRSLPPAFTVDTGADEPTDAPVALSFAEAFASADATAGARVWSQCRACHVADEQRNNVGPYLYNVVGRPVGAVEGFSYSGALPAGEVWTPENIYAFIENPRAWAPGTSMSYAGLRAQTDRVNLIAFLIENSPDFDPASMPAAAAPAEEAAVEEAPAEEAVAEEAATEEAPAEQLSAFAQMVADGDVAAGARVWNQCRACHVADATTNRVGPHLGDVVGRPSNSVEGFRYSGRLPDVVWTLDELDLYLTNPRGYAPGTSMAFNGLRNQQDRANVLAYIQSLN
jgi:cytochrome c2